MDSSPSRNIRLLSNQVLLKLSPPPLKIGMLWLPETARNHKENNELYRGQVMAKGPGYRNPKNGRLTPCDVEIGDDVQFYWMGGLIDVSNWPDSAHIIIRENQIQCIYGQNPN